MSYRVFPVTLPGVIHQGRAEIYRTAIHEAVSGREWSVQRWAQPRRLYSIDLDFLRSAVSRAELQNVVRFCAAHAGAREPFLVVDPEDNTAVRQMFGLGDGSIQTFQFQRVPQAPLSDVTGTYAVANMPRRNMLPSLAASCFTGTSSGGSGTAPLTASNAGIAPDMTVSAMRVTLDKGTGTALTDYSRVYGPTVYFEMGETYCFSVWLKSADDAEYDIALEVASGIYSVVRVTADWQRLSVSWPTLHSWTANTDNQFQANCYLTLRGAYSSVTSNYASLLVWGPQLEVGVTSPTELIPSGATAGTEYPVLWPSPTAGYGPVCEPRAATASEMTGLPSDWGAGASASAYCAYNWAIFSEALGDTNWTKYQVTISADATTEPLTGTTTADKIVEDTNGGEHYVEQSITAFTSNDIYAAFSAYVKPAGRDWCYVAIVQRDGTTVAGCYFDVANGTVGTANGGANGSIASAGSGWYRCTVGVSVGNGASSPRGRIKTATADATPTHTGDGSSGIYAWGVMFSPGTLQATYCSKLATGVRPASVIGTANSVGGAPVRTSLDWQGARAPTTRGSKNIVRWSEEFFRPSWSRSGGYVIGYATTAPDGRLADSFNATAGGTYHMVQAQYPKQDDNRPYYWSVYAKAGANAATVAKSRYLLMRQGGTSEPRAIFDLSGGVIVASANGGTAQIQSAGNGWFRCGMLIPPNSTNTYMHLSMTDGAINTQTFSAAGTEQFYLWGAMIEPADDMGPYLPTAGAIAAAPAEYDGSPTAYLTNAANPHGTKLTRVARKNEITYSCDMTNAAWVKTNVTAAASGVAPDGVSTATQLTDNATSASHVIGRVSSASVPAGLVTASAYYKAGTHELGYLQAYASTGTSGGAAMSAGIYFDMRSGKVLSYSESATGAFMHGRSTAIGSGWWRYEVTMRTWSASTITVNLQFVGTGGLSVSYSGASTTMYVWGAQAEIGPHATLLIPTVGSTISRADWTLGVNGTVTTNFTPAIGDALSWSGGFYRRVRFKDDKLDFARIVNGYWRGRVELVEVVPVAPAVYTPPSGGLDGQFPYSLG